MIWGGPILGPPKEGGALEPKRPNQSGFRNVLDFPGIISILSYEFIISRLFPKLTIDYVILCYII